MNPDQLSQIRLTVANYPIKGLRWLPIDNIIVGHVFDPLLDKFVVCTWKRNGSVTKKYGGVNKKDFYLKINLAD